jgi:sec-independent protein translocase protein TatB
VFDIGFSEIIVCAIVALIVIGPERMPEAVRTMGLWIGRLKRSLRETRVEIERQIGVDDIRRQLHNEDIMRSIEDARKNINDVIQQAQQDVNAIEHNSPRVYAEETALPDHAHMTDSSHDAHADTSTSTPIETKTPL